MSKTKVIAKQDFSFIKQLTNVENLLINTRNGKLYKFVLSAVEKPLIESILEKTGGNQLQAADILGINRNTLHAKIRKLGIEVGRCKKS
jgi:DNA-binding protein Fis